MSLKSKLLGCSCRELLLIDSWGPPSKEITKQKKKKDLLSWHEDGQRNGQIIDMHPDGVNAC